ncbi:chemotaxis protein CheD [Candidatus Poribacteria bacterium]|nr:chemotaxis protein CheD [Candidatus Poribacteria bacterium]
MAEIVRVNMSHYMIAKSPVLLETIGLGSCIGIVLFDPHMKIGGMAHCMLPDMSCVKRSANENLAKYVNTAIDKMYDEMIEKGANKKKLWAKLAGGANMFPDVIKDSSKVIGFRNTEAAKIKLKQLEIPIIAEDTGDSHGRTIVLDTETGDMEVRSIYSGEKII